MNKRIFIFGLCIIFLLSTICGVSAVNITTNNVAFYSFSNSGTIQNAMTDQTGNGFNATNNSLTLTNDNIYFNGVNGYLYNILVEAAGTSSFCMRAYINSITSAEYFVDLRYDGGDGFTYFDGSPPRYTTSSGTIYINNVSNNFFNLSEWHIVCVSGMTTTIKRTYLAVRNNLVNYANMNVSWFGIWNGSLNDSQRAVIFSDGQDPSWNPHSLPPTGQTLFLNNPYPVNDSSFNFTPIDVGAYLNFTYNTTCDLYINDTLNQTKTISNMTLNGIYNDTSSNASKIFDGDLSTFSTFTSLESAYLNISKTETGNDDLFRYILRWYKQSSTSEPISIYCVNDKNNLSSIELLREITAPIGITIPWNLQINKENNPGCLNISDDYIILYIANLEASGFFRIYEIYQTSQEYNLTYEIDNIPEGSYKWQINCSDNTSSNGTNPRIFTFDQTFPYVETDFKNNSIVFKNNLSGSFNFTDNIGLFSVNVSIDGTQIYAIKNIENNTFQYDLQYNASSDTIGNHSLSIRFADGHTAELLKNYKDYKPKKSLFGDELTYNFEGVYKNNKLNLKSKNKKIGDNWEAIQNKDRFSEIFKPSKKTKSHTFTLTSETPIHIYSDPNCTYGCQWLIVDEHWKDFVVTNHPNAKIDRINRISPFEVDIIMSGFDPQKEEIIFNSTGDLNIRWVNYTWYKINISETYEDPIFSDYQTSYNLTVDFNQLYFDISGVNPIARIIINDTIYNSTLKSFTNESATFGYNFTPPQIDNKQQIQHFWSLNITNKTIGLENTTLQNQTLYNISIGVCVGANNNTILTLFYYDEINGSPINLTNSYIINVTDGTTTYILNDSFIGNNQDSYCVNIEPGIVSYNFEVYGTFTLEKDGYTTRVIDINPIAPISASNNPPANYSFYMIPVSNSSTVSYTWMDRNFQLLEGTMRIWKCNENNTKVLVSSSPVISGVTTANIELLTQAYSYDIIVDGVIYNDPSGYSACHVENTQSLLYYVDVITQSIDQTFGLNSVNCIVSKVDNTTINAQWTANPNNSTYVQACVEGYQSTLFGQKLFFTNCSDSGVGYNWTFGITENSRNTTYQVKLIQGQNIAYCQGLINYLPSTPAQENFGLMGVFGVFMIILGIGLTFAKNKTVSLIGVSVALIVIVAIGLLNISTTLLISLILLLLIVMGVAYYSKTR